MRKLIIFLVTLLITATSFSQDMTALVMKVKTKLDQVNDYEADGKMKTSQRKVSDKGYNFNYFTHIYTTKTGNKYYFCYEFGYIHLENDLLMVVKRSEGV